MRLTRRQVLQALGSTAIAGATVLPAPGCRREMVPAVKPIVRINGNDAKLGHRLRTGDFPPPVQTIRRDVLVVGAGVAGLSAAWRLAHAGVGDVEVLDLAPSPGGTARSGKNAVSSFPIGAHYLPVPNPENTLCLRLLEEIGLCTGRDSANRPVFDARHLVFEPEDRLFYRGKWYPGLFLAAGASAEDNSHYDAFKAYTDRLREARGRDGRPAFAIPVHLSSTDPRFMAYDAESMAAFMKRKGWTSERLRWLVNYACRDDYGASVEEVSAWAGLHYFAGRRPWRTSQTEGTQYFTWPEGNGFLVKHLQKRVTTLTLGRLAYATDPKGEALVYDSASDRSIRYQARRIILCTPNHITARLTGGARPRFAEHAPWLVANLTLTHRPPELEPAWNNVLYDSHSLGFVDAGHQRFAAPGPTVWSWYRAYPRSERGALLTASEETLAESVLQDLAPAFGDVARFVTSVDLWRWGHGTIVPAPGLISDTVRTGAKDPLGNLHFAHTDLSGLPLFEEAQHHGVRAAEEVLRALGVKHAAWAPA